MQLNKRPYEQAYYPPQPTAMTKFFRTCVLWQLVRFVIINLKMLKVIAKGHS